MAPIISPGIDLCKDQVIHGQTEAKQPEWWLGREALWEVCHCVSLAQELGELQRRAPSLCETWTDAKVFCSLNS